MTGLKWVCVGFVFLFLMALADATGMVPREMNRLRRPSLRNVKDSKAVGAPLSSDRELMFSGLLRVRL